MNRSLRIETENRKRQRQKDIAGAGVTQVTFQIPIRGSAGNGLQMSPTDLLPFDVRFEPEQGRMFPRTPGFTSGFSLESDRGNINDMLGIVGFANVAHWSRDRNGYFDGAIVHIGVVHLGQFDEPVAYKGFVTCAFVGTALQSPVDMPNRPFRRSN